MKKATLIFVCNGCGDAPCTIEQVWNLRGESLTISCANIRIPEVVQCNKCLSPGYSTHPKWELENVVNTDFNQKEIAAFKKQVKER